MISSAAAEAEQATTRAKVADLIWGYTISASIGIAARLGIADLLKVAPLKPADLAVGFGIAEDTFRRLLRAFECAGLLRSRPDGYVELTDTGEWLRSDIPGTLQPLAARTHDLYYPAWGNLLAALGESDNAFRKAFGSSYFDYMARHEDHIRTFNALMATMSLRGARALAANFDFSNFRHVVDVGGGEGIVLGEILRMNEHLNGSLFDKGDILERAPERLGSAGVLQRCSIIPGDFLDHVPPSGDVYLLKHVLHNWSDTDCVRILGKCRVAMAERRAHLLIMERVVESEWGAEDVRSDLHMMVMMNGAERTESDFRTLLSRAGFDLIRNIRTDISLSILDSLPK